jgi:hypothetical protein
MKLHHFGLWFTSDGREWSTKIPPNPGFKIFYDGWCIGYHSSNYDLDICLGRPHIIKLRNEFPVDTSIDMCNIRIGRLLTLDDFEIIPNPDYLGKQ